MGSACCADDAMLWTVETDLAHRCEEYIYHRVRLPAPKVVSRTAVTPAITDPIDVCFTRKVL